MGVDSESQGRSDRDCPRNRIVRNGSCPGPRAATQECSPNARFVSAARSGCFSGRGFAAPSESNTAGTPQPRTRMALRAMSPGTCYQR